MQTKSEAYSATAHGPTDHAAFTATAEKNASRALDRKLFRRIVPLAVIGYVIAQIDRSNVAFAKLQFMTDLSFSEAIYGLGAGLFFAGYFLFEVPSNLLLARIGARLTFARIMVLWGALSVGMGFVSTPAEFYVMRFLLGAAEAGFFPGIILYFSYWLPPEIRGRATAIFAMGASIAGIIGSPLSAWLMSLDGLHALRGWQLIFIYEGIPAILLGVFCFFYVQDKPERAHWLSPEEKTLLRERLGADKPAETHSRGALAQAFRDPTVYLFALAYLSILAGTQAVSLWTPTLLKKLGIDITTIGLLAAIPPAAAMIGIFLVGRSSDRRQERRWHFALSMLVAAACLALLPLAANSTLGIVALMALVASGAWAALAVFWTIPPAYLAPNAKAGGIAFISSAGAIGGFVSPLIVGGSSNLTGSLYAGFACIGAMLAISAMTLVLGVARSRGA
ncbi:MFS transporter [Burkholderia sp. 22PA0099]|uniref:MFS transporter n=1 Tax=Burkholderia sp. 22PA0099 TaxID=3237372 RepID=UPI0039C333A1